MSIQKSLFLSLVFFSLARPGQADLYDTDLNREQAQLQHIDSQQKESEKGYQYNTYQRDKELIFKQLEVISGNEETRYILVPGDTLSISYNDRDEKTGALYRVSDTGEISLPVVGLVKVAGLNRQQARSLITEKLQEYIRNPNVELTVNAAGRVMVLGEVHLPGMYYMQPNLTVMEAIMKAGSYNKESASLKSVVLVRGAEGKAEAKRLNLHKMITKADRSDDLLVKPGDLIYVPKTLVYDLTKFKDDVYRWVSLYYSFGRLPAPPPVEENQPILYKQ
jgi:protein involved in polysaccharide export with SLBB domain